MPAPDYERSSRDARGSGGDPLELEVARLEPEADRRRDGRVALDVPARAESNQGELTGRLQNLSVSGALLVTPGPEALVVGTGLEVTFRLPTGPQLRLSATVRWNDEGPLGHASSGLQFLNVSGPNRAYLEHYVELAASEAGVEPVRAEVVHKYQLSFDAAGRAQAVLGGMLSREEAQAFRALLEQRVTARKSARMHFALDVRRLAVCSQEVILELRRCFELLGQHSEVVGLLIGSKSLAVTQLVRAARDAGLADHVFCVNEPEDAGRIWSQMQGVTR